MRRLPTIAFALTLVVATAAMPLAAADAGAFATAQEDEDETDEDVAPGEQLAGVVAVQEAEIDGEVAERAYGLKIAGAQTEEAKADAVAEQAADVEERLEELENRTEELNAAYEDGKLTRGQYHAEMAAVAAERTTAERLANGTAATATELDADLLAERGIDVEAIQTLSERASDLDGPEVAEIARSIAGAHVGQPVDDDREPGEPIERPVVEGDGPSDDADDENEADDADAATNGDENASDSDDQDAPEGGADEPESATDDGEDEDEQDRAETDQ